LDSITCCGESLAKRVGDSFAQLFTLLVSTLEDTNLDTTSRLYALNVCGSAFRDTDVTLLANTKIFYALRKIISDPTPPFSPSESPLPLFSTPPIEDEEEEEDADAKRAKETLRQEEVARQGRLKLEEDNWKARNAALQQAAWTSFRLLAAQCIGWNVSSTDDHLNTNDKTAVLQTQDLVFNLLCDELTRISQSLRIHDVHGVSTPETAQTDEQCYQLLSLMYLIGGVKTLARKSNIDDLLRLLGTNLAPRSQRLVLRLCRKMLPHHAAEESAEKMTNFFLDQIAMWTIKGKLDRESSSKSPKSSVDKMDVDKEVTQPTATVSASDNEEEEEDESKKANFSVYLHSWALGHRRLAEACINTLGQDFFNQPAQPQQPQVQPSLRASSSSQQQQQRLAAQQTEAKAAQLVSLVLIQLV